MTTTLIQEAKEAMNQQKNSLINLPDDVLINGILLKLDTKSLGKLRCVCKYLQSFISSSAFLKLHCHDQFNNNPLILLVSGNSNLYYSLNFNGSHEYVEIARGLLPMHTCFTHCLRSPFSLHPLLFGSCNGLLCLVESEIYPPTLWNPTTKEYKKLPPPFSRSSPLLSHPNKIIGCTRVVAYGLGYDSIVDDYKIIQCENSIYHQYFPLASPSHITDFQVYTLGTDTWRRINDNPYESYFTTIYHSLTPGMFVNGALHWILSEKESFGSKIIAFDIEKEIFRAEVPIPHSRLSDASSFNNWSLHMLRGCLCIYERLQCESSYIDVWMMKDYGVMESWTKLFTINDYRAFRSCRLDIKVLNFCENGEVILGTDDRSQQDLILYNPINKTSRTINLGEIRDTCCKEIYIESLVSLNSSIYGYGTVENKHSQEIKMKRKRLA